jgi:ribulose-phosphate 3-epimerase
MDALTPQVVPSMLDCDQSRLAEELADLERAGADRVQWDIMDGSFVPRITHGADPIQAVRGQSKLTFEAHLMVDRPEGQWQAFAGAGCEVVIVHAEATRHLHLLLQDIRDAGVRAGVAINPATPLEAVIDVLDLVDHLLVMTVNPGRGGQKFITSMLGKVRDARELIDDAELVIDLEVDGGVTAQTAPQVAQAGANLLVAGSAVNRHPEGGVIAINQIRAEAQRGWRRGIKLRHEGESSAGETATVEPGEDGAAGLARGVELFNQGEFWEAHEAWEGAWMPHRRTPEGDFYKGLVQVAAGFYHYRRRNKNGALIKWRDGAAYLRPFAPEHRGIVLGPIIETVEAHLARLEDGSEWPELAAPRLEISSG